MVAVKERPQKQADRRVEEAMRLWAATFADETWAEMR